MANTQDQYLRQKFVIVRQEADHHVSKWADVEYHQLINEAAMIQSANGDETHVTSRQMAANQYASAVNAWREIHRRVTEKIIAGQLDPAVLDLDADDPAVAFLFAERLDADEEE